MAALYDPILVRHARTPYGRGVSPDALTADGKNRPCGDRLTFGVAAADPTTAADPDGPLVIRFEGEGCALCLAAASALCEAADGRPQAEVMALCLTFRAALEGAPDDPAPPALGGDLAHFLKVRALPPRKGCVILAPDVLLDALSRRPVPP